MANVRATVPVPCKPLRTIVSESMPRSASRNKVRLATFLSLDVQGAEELVKDGRPVSV